MFKKIWVMIVAALILALMAGMWVSGDALADEGSGDGNFITRWRIARRGLGQVIQITDDDFTIRKQNGEEYTLSVGERSRFRYIDKTELSFDDLRVDQWVVVVPRHGESDELLARLVVILPEDFDPSQLMGVRGLVASVDIAADRFTLQTRSGEELVFEVDEDTRYAGEVQELGDLQPDMRAFVGAVKVEDGDPLAKVVRAGAPRGPDGRVRYAGRISDIDIGNSTFSLELRRSGKTLTFLVNENTRFKGRGVSIGGLEDLELGMFSLVIARQEGDSALVALAVAAATGDQLPKFEARAVGRVLSVDNNSFVILARGGREIDIQVKKSTVFRSRVEGVEGLEDLQPGMIVAFGGEKLGEGTNKYRAELVIVLRAAQ